MSDDNIIQFPMRQAGPSEFERLVIDHIVQAGLDPALSGRLLERLRPFLNTLKRPFNISIPVPIEAVETQRAIELLLQLQHELSIDLLVERTKRELDLFD